MRNRIDIFFILLLLTNICFSQTKNGNDQNKKREISKIAVLKTEKYWGFKNFEPTDLNENEILQAEKMLTKSVKNYNLNNTYRPIQLRNYHRQYVAAKNLNGEKEIFINCFCEAPAINWKEELTQVDDGGNCFFSLKINFTTKKVEELYVNGP